MSKTVNAENVLKVADAIENRAIPGVGFNMDWYELNDPEKAKSYDRLNIENCGTVACIAGWTHLLFDDDSRKEPFTHAKEVLGLSYDQARQLFYADNHPDKVDDGWGSMQAPLDDITPEAAIRTLRHLAATGEVDWSIAATGEAK